MLLFQRAIASILFVVLVMAASRAHADGILMGAAAATPPAAATAQQPPVRTRIEWRDVVWGDRHGRMLHAEKPYQNGRLLDGEGLYVALDRLDLAEAYRKRQETKASLDAATGVLLVTTLIVALVASSERKSGGAAPEGALIGLGAGLALTGGFAIANASMPGDVVTNDELHRLVDAHNRTP